MRRSICHCEPSLALAGEINNWKFIYTLSSALPKGTILRFDMVSDGRSIDWEAPNVNLKESRNVIYGLTESGKVLQAKEVDVEDRFMPQYEFVLPEALKANEELVIVLGAPKGKKVTEETGNQAQYMTQRRRTFHLYIDPTGKRHYEEPEVFTLDVKGNVLKNIRVLTPSFVTKNKRFDIIVRFEDEFGNLTNNTDEDTLIELSYENLRENLNWKLFIPETGFITLPNLYFNEVGVYTIRLFNSTTKEEFKGAPIKCFADPHPELFWGLLHGDSERIDSAENIESCLRHFRDEKAYNFFATSPFESQEETPNELWKLISNNILEFDEPDRFSTMLGFQWIGDDKSEGIRQVIYLKDHKQIIRKKDAKGGSLSKLYNSFTPKEILSIPSFTMGTGSSYDFKNFNPEYERVVEIYNAWGSSECTKKEGNTRPIHPEGKIGVKESAEGSIQNALLRNCRFGFVGGGLDDRGLYSPFFDNDQAQYSPGLTAILATEHNKNALAEALAKRSCYATTGERIIVGLSIAGTPMGGEVNTTEKPGLIVNRHLSGYVAGTTLLKTVEIIRNGKVIKTFEPKKVYSLEFTYDDMDDLAKVVVDAKDKKPAFAYYYIRVTQEDGHIAWSSPIWVDYIPMTAAEKKARRDARMASKRTVPKPPPEDFNVEEEDEEVEDDFTVVDDEDDDEE